MFCVVPYISSAAIFAKGASGNDPVVILYPIVLIDG